jgi:argininosuccinate lyase
VAAERLGFTAIFENSLDAVAARDVETEYAMCCTQTLVHLSRLAEELVLWGSAEFSWATYDDTHTTGSSALPHKKNPDVAELTRAKAASAIGHLTGLLAVQKGLPLSYNRDLQQDKEHLFIVDDDAGMALRTLAGMVTTAELNPPPPSDLVTALDLAEVLVERGVPFREAHRAVGSLVADVVGRGETLTSVSEEDLSALHPVLRPDDLAVLDPTESVRSRRSRRGGSFASVVEQLEEIDTRIAAIAEEISRNP